MPAILVEMRVFSKLGVQFYETVHPAGYLAEAAMPQVIQNITVNIIKKYVQPFTAITGSYTILGTTHQLGTPDLIAVVYDNAVPANMITVSYTVDFSTFDVTLTFLGVTSGTIVLM